jgi:hypothetical protein
MQENNKILVQGNEETFMQNKKSLTQIDKVCKIMEEWVESRKVGHITVNFFKGGISSVNKNETIKIEK